MIKVAVFASGNGSNAINLFKYFRNHPYIHFDIIYCNNPNAGIIAKSKESDITCRIFTKAEWLSGSITSELISNKTDFIVLAGFIWLVPSDLVSSFPAKIINIHPALLPNYGGKGMYGMAVHQKIIANNEHESGITIHLVNEEYDKGNTLFQAKTKIEDKETPESLAAKIHELEYKYFPEVVEKYISEHKEKGR